MGRLSVAHSSPPSMATYDERGSVRQTSILFRVNDLTVMISQDSAVMASIKTDYQFKKKVKYCKCLKTAVE